MPIILLSIVLSMLGCSQSDFSGNAASRKAPHLASMDKDQDGPEENSATTPNSIDDQFTDGIGKTDSDADDEPGGTSGIELDDTEIVHTPQSCTASTGSFAPSDSSTCPAHAAAYTVDDGKTIHFGCCPLPARDILSKTPAQARQSGTCLDDEVITGVEGNSVLCTKINTDRYVLAAPKATCYHGSGASGGNGSKACGAPPTTLANITSRFGSDACIGFPFGSLIIARTGKECRDAKAAQLLYKDTGQPVTMYE